jgi:hypothetical protein
MRCHSARRPAAGALRAPLAALLRLALLGALCAVPGGVPARAEAPPVQRLSRYEALLGRPLAGRVQPADAAVLEREHETNLHYGDDVRPRAADPGHPLLPVVRGVLGSLPAPVARLAAAHLAAVYLVEGDVGTATTEGVQDAQGRWSHAYILLNLTALQRNANAWATWKEHSAFRDSPGYALAMTLAPADADDRAGAVRFILLHELGHVLGLGLGVHGSWDDAEPGPATQRSPFVALSWVYQSAEAGRPAHMRSRFAQRFPLLGRVAFYRFDKAPLALSDAPQVYAELAQTNFPSLYGTQQPFDDFAEAFAIYVHTRLLGGPYRVQVLHDGREVARYRSCIVTGTCPGKIAALKALLGGPAASATPAAKSAAKPAAKPAAGPAGTARQAEAPRRGPGVLRAPGGA